MHKDKKMIFFHSIFRLSVACSLLIMVCILSPAIAGATKPLVLVSVPWRDTAILNQIYAPMIKLLETQLNRQVHLYVSKDYKELAQRLTTGAADLGIFGGNSYVEAKLDHPQIRYLATCKQPTAFYNSLIIVRKDSSIKGISDLAGKSFAFTDKSSTSGYLYPLLMLTAAKINPETDFSITYFLEKHDKVYEAVAKGIIDAGGVSKTALKKSIATHGDVFQILSTSDPIPRNPVVAAPHLSQKTIEKITKILSLAQSSPIFKHSDSILRGFDIRTDRFYDIVRDARKLKQ